jgi:HEAT repeat protein
MTIPILEKALDGADATTFHHALDALANFGAPAVPGLIDGLKHEALRAEIAFLLGEIGPAAAPATEALVGLTHDEDHHVRSEAVHALASIGPGAKAAVPDLVELLGQPECPITHETVYALGKIGPDAKSAEPTLLKLAQGSDEALSVISAWALIQIGGASARTATEVVPVLSACLDAPLPKSRQLSAEALGSLGSLAKDAVPELAKALDDEVDDEARAATAEALAAIRGSAPETAAIETEAIARGSTVVTLADDTQLKLGGTIIAKLPKGSQLKVLELRGSWVGVRATVGEEKKTGWVPRTAVATP